MDCVTLALISVSWIDSDLLVFWNSGFSLSVCALPHGFGFIAVSHGLFLCFSVSPDLSSASGEFCPQPGFILRLCSLQGFVCCPVLF